MTQPQLHAAFPQTHRLGINSLPVAGKEPQASNVTCSFNFRKCLKCRLIRKTFKFFILNTKMFSLTSVRAATRKITMN